MGFREIVLLKFFLPLIWSGIATVAIFAVYTTWNDFIFALVFTNSNELKTLNVGLTNLAIYEYGTQWGLLSAGSIISFILLLYCICFKRYFLAV